MTRLLLPVSLFVLISLFTLLLPVAAEAKTKMFDFKDPKEMNAVSLSVDAPFEPVVGYADGISGMVQFDPADPRATTGKIVVDVSSVRFTNGGYTQTARNYALEEKKYPQITCELKKIQTIKTVRPGVYTGTVAIAFTCHGITKSMIVPLDVQYLPGVARQRFPDFDGDLLVVRCNFTIHRAEFNIAKGVPINEVAEEVGVRVAIVGTEKKPVASAVEKAVTAEPNAAVAPVDIPITVEGSTSTLAQRMAFHKVPGVSVALIQDFKVQWVRHYGEAASDKAVNDNTLYMAGAMGNVVTVALALKAAETGQLGLDTPISTVLTSWKVPASDLLDPARPITVRDLLMHRSGFAFSKYEGYTQGDPIPGTTAILNGQKPARTPATRVAYAPGSEFRLAMENYLVLQQVAEDLAKRPYSDLITDIAFKPLGMTTSRYTVPDAGLAAIGHDADGKPVPGGWRTYPEQAASGLWTTPREFANCLVELLRCIAGRGTYLKPETAKLLIQPIPECKQGIQAMGFGVDDFRGTPYIFRGGNTDGYFCHLDADPEVGNAVIVFTNGDLCWKLTNEIRDAVATTAGFRGFAH